MNIKYYDIQTQKVKVLAEPLPSFFCDSYINYNTSLTLNLWRCFVSHYLVFNFFAASHIGVYVPIFYGLGRCFYVLKTFKARVEFVVNVSIWEISALAVFLSCNFLFACGRRLRVFVVSSLIPLRRYLCDSS